MTFPKTRIYLFLMGHGTTWVNGPISTVDCLCTYVVFANNYPALLCLQDCSLCSTQRRMNAYVLKLLPGDIHREVEMSWLKRSSGKMTLINSNEFPISLLQKATWNHRGQIKNPCRNPIRKQHTELQAAWWELQSCCISNTMAEQQTWGQSSKSLGSAFVSMPPCVTWWVWKKYILSSQWL